jgi:uncharacterized protein (TIGR03086 family)
MDHGLTQFDVLDRGGVQFARVLGAVTPQDWASPTPCEGWAVRDLVVHVVGGTVMSVALLDGASSEEAYALLQTDVLGDEPLDTFVAAQAELGAAIRSVDLDMIVHHMVGDIPAAMLLGFRIGDLTVHSWDLARAIHADDSLDPVLVQAVWDAVSPMRDSIGETGVFGDGPSGDVPDDAPLQTRLLDLTGRRP